MSQRPQKVTNPDVPELTSLRWALKYADSERKKTSYKLGEAQSYISELEDENKILNQKLKDLESRIEFLEKKSEKLEHDLNEKKQEIKGLKEGDNRRQLLQLAIQELEKLINKLPKDVRRIAKRNYYVVDVNAKNQVLRDKIRSIKAESISLKLKLRQYEDNPLNNLIEPE